MPRLKFDIERMARFDDPREIPAYTFAEASRYLHIPVTTIRSWLCGTTWTDSSRKKRSFQRVIDLPEKGLNLLSFFNLAETYVLRSLRDQYDVRLDLIRKALEFVQSESGWDRPLIQEDFRTDGVRLFVERLGRLLDASSQQLMIPGVLEDRLNRIDWQNALAVRLYPYTRPEPSSDAPKRVVIDPARSFGRPIVEGTGVPTSVIADRYKAGDSIKALVKEYGGPQEDIEEAIRCELQVGAAA